MGGFRLLPAKLRNKVTCNSWVGRCAPWEVTNGAGSLVLLAEFNPYRSAVHAERRTGMMKPMGVCAPDNRLIHHAMPTAVTVELHLHTLTN